MSLLNQVLQDLDERAPPGESRPVRLSVAPAVHQHAADQQDGSPDWMRLGAGIGVIVAFVVAVWIFYGPDPGQAETNIPPEPAVPTAVVAATPAPVPEPAVSSATEDIPISGSGSDPYTGPAAMVALPAETGSAADRENRQATREMPVAEFLPTASDASLPVSQRDADDSPKVAGTAGYLPLRNTELSAREEMPSETMTVASRTDTPVKTAKSPVPETMELARVAIEQGELSSAEMILQRRLQGVPGDRVARELLVGLMLRGGRYDAAARQLDQGLKQHPGHVKFSLIKARLLAQSGEVAGAIRILESSTPSEMGRVERLQMLGALYQQESRYEQAVDSYRRLLELDSSSGTSWVGLAISLDGLGDSAALEAYDRALRFGGLPAAADSYARQRFSQLELTVD